MVGCMIRTAAAVLAIAALAPGVAAASSGSSRGDLISVQPVSQLDSAQVATYLTKYRLDASRARFGVTATRIVYRTIDPRGKPTTASTLIVLPRNDNRSLRHVTWLHGTTGYRGSTASVTDGDDRAAAFLFASAGYLTTAPDYLGLGTGPGHHPYLDGPSTVTASVDAFRAATKFAQRGGRRADPRMLVTGHSQGGQAAMAVGQALNRDGGLELGGLAPISAPLHLSQALPDALAGGIDNGVAYLAYWTVAWNRLHHLYDSPADAFRDPAIEEVFDGDHTNQEIFQRLPRSVDDLFTPEYRARLEEPTGVLRAKIREADSFCDWRPEIPVTLYTSGGDGDVKPGNSTYCDQRLKRHHGKSTVIDLGEDVGHGQAAKLAIPRVLATFDRT